MVREGLFHGQLAWQRDGAGGCLSRRYDLGNSHTPVGRSGQGESLMPGDRCFDAGHACGMSEVVLGHG